MNKFKPVILTSIFCAIILSLLTYWIPQIDWPFLPYLILAGCFMVWVQKESVSYKFLDKLLLGSVLFGFLLTIFIFIRMFAMSHLVYDAPLPFRELWDADMFALAGTYSFLAFLGGLMGIFLKGLYSLGKGKLDWVIIVIGALLTSVSSLAVFKIKVGGTVMSGYYGLPYSYFTYRVKDILDDFSIGEWSFSPGSSYHYVVLNYSLYLAIFVSFFYLIKFVNKRTKQKQFNSTFLLFGLLIIMTTFYISFMSIKMSYIQHQISGAKYCESESDCVIVGNVSPFSCAIVSNKDSADRILKLVNSYPSEGELSCSGREKATCRNNKCRVSIDHTPNETNWDMLKKAVEDCRVTSIMQAHSKEVTAVLKGGRVIIAVEPEIDDIIEIVTNYREKCGEIMMMIE